MILVMFIRHQYSYETPTRLKLVHRSARRHSLFVEPCQGSMTGEHPRYRAGLHGYLHFSISCGQSPSFAAGAFSLSMGHGPPESASFTTAFGTCRCNRRFSLCLVLSWASSFPLARPPVLTDTTKRGNCGLECYLLLARLLERSGFMSQRTQSV